MQFLIPFPFPSPAGVPHRFIHSRELCFPSLPFPSVGAASLLRRCGGDPPCPPGSTGAGCALGWGWGDALGPGLGRCFPFQALGTHNSRNRRLGVKRFKLGSGTGMRSAGPAASSSRAYGSPGKWANCFLWLTRLGVRWRVFVGGRAVPSQPCAAGSKHGGC